MGAKRPDPACQPAYDAADLWIDRALSDCDSLFTPGVPIWSLEPLAEARALLVNNRDALKKGDDCLGRLERVMEGSSRSPELYQLMGEAAYVAYLIIHKGARTQDTKIKNINRILGWSCKPVEIPDCLRDGLANGIMAPGRFVYFERRLDAIIRLAERWKRVGADVAMLDRCNPESPWRFQEFLANLKVRDAWQVAPLHLVHPDTFEPLVWSNKEKVAAAKFHPYVTGALPEEVNRRIHRIRAKLEREFPEGFDFYGPRIRRMWNDKRKN